ncbi:hypothetical protein Bbelb_050430 [Branchiostoma belcheri]|nr:hypothetical protein Bbelb_050430 [Branchiostoma belcheri]
MSEILSRAERVARDIWGFPRLKDGKSQQVPPRLSTRVCSRSHPGCQRGSAAGPTQAVNEGQAAGPTQAVNEGQAAGPTQAVNEGQAAGPTQAVNEGQAAGPTQAVNEGQAAGPTQAVNEGLQQVPPRLSTRVRQQVPPRLSTRARQQVPPRLSTRVCSRSHPGCQRGSGSRSHPGCQRGPGSRSHPGCQRGSAAGPTQAVNEGQAAGPTQAVNEGQAAGPTQAVNEGLQQVPPRLSTRARQQVPPRLSTRVCSRSHPGCQRGSGSRSHPGCQRGPGSRSHPGCQRGSAAGPTQAVNEGQAAGPTQAVNEGQAAGPTQAVNEGLQQVPPRLSTRFRQQVPPRLPTRKGTGFPRKDIRRVAGEREAESWKEGDLPKAHNPTTMEMMEQKCSTWYRRKNLSKDCLKYINGGEEGALVAAFGRLGHVEATHPLAPLVHMIVDLWLRLEHLPVERLDLHKETHVEDNTVAGCEVDPYKMSKSALKAKLIKRGMDTKNTSTDRSDSGMDSGNNRTQTSRTYGLENGLDPYGQWLFAFNSHQEISACNETHVRMDMAQHMDICGEVLIECRGCGNTAKRSGLEDHVDNNPFTADVRLCYMELMSQGRKTMHAFNMTYIAKLQALDSSVFFFHFTPAVPLPADKHAAEAQHLPGPQRTPDLYLGCHAAEQLQDHLFMNFVNCETIEKNHIQTRRYHLATQKGGGRNQSKWDEPLSTTQKTTIDRYTAKQARTAADQQRNKKQLIDKLCLRDRSGEDQQAVQKHESTCCHRLEDCLCGMKIKRGSRDQHSSTICPSQPIPCPLGCQSQVKRGTAVLHSSQACPRLVRLCRMPGCNFQGGQEVNREHLAEAAAEYVTEVGYRPLYPYPQGVSAVDIKPLSEEPNMDMGRTWVREDMLNTTASQRWIAHNLSGLMFENSFIHFVKFCFDKEKHAEIRRSGDLTMMFVLRGFSRPRARVPSGEEKVLEARAIQRLMDIGKNKGYTRLSPRVKIIFQQYRYEVSNFHRRNRVYRAISGLLTYGLRRGPPGTYYNYNEDLLDVVRDTYPSGDDVNWMLTNQDNKGGGRGGLVRWTTEGLVEMFYRRSHQHKWKYNKNGMFRTDQQGKLVRPTGRPKLLLPVFEKRGVNVGNLLDQKLPKYFECVNIASSSITSAQENEYEVLRDDVIRNTAAPTIEQRGN